jgi:RNA polymerase sigma-70 factor (ECF subfamily)
LTHPTIDRQIVDAVLTGDTEAFRMLVDRESPSVIGICRRILRDPDEADDVAQEAFIQAYRALGSFRGDGPFGAWVARIAARLATARVVARRDVVRLDSDDVHGWTAGLASGEDPERTVVAGEERQAILAAIAALPAGQRDAIALRFYGDLTLDEIAQATDSPLGTVKSRFHRGLGNLKESLRTRPSP